MSPVANTQISVTRLAGEIGAEVAGVDASEYLPDDVAAQIRQALLDHKVVFLHDQRLDYATQVRQPARRTARPRRPAPRRAH